MKISIIVPNYNGKELLSESLSNLLDKNKSLSNFEFIIVDNNSTDNSESFVKLNYPKIKFLKLDKNYGFTGACNYGSKKAKGEYLLFLNNDCLIDNKNILLLLDYLEKNKQLAACQPIILDRNNGIENIGYLVDLKKAKAKTIKKLSDLKKVNDTSIFESRYVYGLSATCLLIKKDVFEKIGMFDEHFHSYLEDVDLFLRLNKAGYKYEPSTKAKCVHQHMATSCQMGNYKQRQDFKNWIRIIAKNYPIKYLIKYCPSLLIERMKNLNGVIKSVILSKSRYIWENR